MLRMRDSSEEWHQAVLRNFTSLKIITLKIATTQKDFGIHGKTKVNCNHLKFANQYHAGGGGGGGVCVYV